MNFPILSIIIPLTVDQKIGHPLTDDLSKLRLGSIEIIFTLSEEDQRTSVAFPPIGPHLIKAIHAKASKANQMNCAATNSSGKFLWFLRSNNHLSTQTIEFINQKKFLVQTQSKPLLYYFDLGFFESKNYPMFINAMGAYLRSHVMKLPLGEQGLILSRKIFFQSGMFGLNWEAGEDFHFILKLKKNNFAIKSTNAKIYVNASEYHKVGWWKLTVANFLETYRMIKRFNTEYGNVKT
jgi:hypothetical protein